MFIIIFIYASFYFIFFKLLFFIIYFFIIFFSYYFFIFFFICFIFIFYFQFFKVITTLIFILNFAYFKQKLFLDFLTILFEYFLTSFHSNLFFFKKANFPDTNDSQERLSPNKPHKHYYANPQPPLELPKRNSLQNAHHNNK